RSEDAMRLIPMVRRDAGLIPLVTPTSQIVGSQAVLVALDRKNGKPDYTTTNNQFISLVKGEYGKTPVPVDPAFREKITGSPIEKAYDVSSYKKPENPTLSDMGGMPLASNNEEMLLLELLPSVANGFLRKRRSEEYNAQKAEEVVETVAEVAPKEESEPITGPTLVAPMGGRIISVNVKDGQTVKKGELLLVYEAMKMENDVEASNDAVIKRVLVSEGDVVNTDSPLIEFQD
uniref:biotin/lipoyl-containing protein n=1 Tax=uncultured Duncaniella sp. TaxID=2768039 RepID=UPI0026E54D18